MVDDYYKKKIYLARVDKNDVILGPIERWEAHEQGILHRGFTAILSFENQFLLQHRKHPAFDGRWDLTFSSHQAYEGKELQSDEAAIIYSLEREWNLVKKDLDGEFQKLGSFYYKAKDAESIYTEHEIDAIYLAKLQRLPEANLDYAYGYDLVDSSRKNLKIALAKYDLTPWVEKILEEIKL